MQHPVVKNPKVDDDDSQPHPVDEFVVQQDAPSLNQEKNSLSSFVNEDEVQEINYSLLILLIQRLFSYISSWSDLCCKKLGLEKLIFC